jgi:hypothetical protein
MALHYTSQALAKVAQETARNLGCQAVHWWQEEKEPHRLSIVAKPLHLPHQALMVQLHAVLPPLSLGSAPESVAVPTRDTTPENKE